MCGVRVRGRVRAIGPARVHLWPSEGQVGCKCEQGRAGANGRVLGAHDVVLRHKADELVLAQLDHRVVIHLDRAGCIAICAETTEIRQTPCIRDTYISLNDPAEGWEPRALPSTHTHPSPLHPSTLPL